MPEILFTPMIFSANAVMNRRRNPETVHLRKTVAVEIRTATAEDAPMVVDLDRSGHLRDLDGTLLIPLRRDHYYDGDGIMTVDQVRALTSDADVLAAGLSRSGGGDFVSYGLPNAAYATSAKADEILPHDDPSIRSDVADYEARAYERLAKGYSELVAVDGRLYRPAWGSVPILAVTAAHGGSPGLGCEIRSVGESGLSNYDNRDARISFSLFDKYHFGSAFDEQFDRCAWSKADVLGGGDVAERFFVETLPSNMKAVRRMFESMFQYVKPMECPVDILSVAHEYRTVHAPLWDSADERDACEVLAAVAVLSDAVQSSCRREDRREEMGRTASSLARMARMVLASVHPHQRHLEKIARSAPGISDAGDDEAFSMGI